MSEGHFLMLCLTDLADVARALSDPCPDLGTHDLCLAHFRTEADGR